MPFYSFVIPRGLLGLNAIWARKLELVTLLWSWLNEVSAVRVRDLGKVKSGLVTFQADEVAARDVECMLRNWLINVDKSSVAGT